jgi:hypothetical protein
MPVSEYAQMQVIKNLTTKLDWTSARRKSSDERLKLDNARLAYSIDKKAAYFKEYHDDLVKSIIHAKTPNWGSFKLTILK